MAVLVTGCAGYIGSIASQILLEQGFSVVGIDNLSTGFKKQIPSAVKFYESCISSKETLEKIFQENDINSIIHFAGYIQVAESVSNPEKYIDNNLYKSTKFLEFIYEKNIKAFVFSSSAAVYGEPKQNPIKESAALHPINPYGETKLKFEQILHNYSNKNNDFKYIALRYFNVCGAYKDHGECHDPETHLIPLVLDAALGKRENIRIFGNDYPTTDGTAVRDYVHVVDLVEAHILALQIMLSEHDSSSKYNRAYNIAYGQGFSVREIINTVQKVTSLDFTVIESERRAGDPAELIADPSAAFNLLNWQAKYNKLETIIQDAYQHRKHYYQGGK